MKNRAAATAAPETQALTAEAPAPLERVLIETNPHKMEQCRQAFHSGRPVIDAAYQAYKSLGLDSLSIAEVIRLAVNKGLENHVRDVMYEANATLVAFPISKETLMAGMELPKDFPKVQQAFNILRETAMDSNRWYHSMNPINAEFYQIDGNDQVVINSAALEEYLDSAYNRYITNQRELQAHAELKQAFEIIKGVIDQALDKQAVVGPRGSGIIGLDFFNNHTGDLVFRPERIPGLFGGGRI